jgi:predicted Rossmann fold nucleotide-binding protein DprA/Smf involved in DNA uptake
VYKTYINLLGKKNIMNYGIIGSRKFKNRALVEAIVDQLPTDVKVISGGCEGVDKWAMNRAYLRGLNGTEFLPKMKTREAYFARNRLIAENSDTVIAFIPRGQYQSGTWNTINHCRRLNVPYVVLDEDGVGWDREWQKMM